jgi:DNA-binding transcriptional regulator YiaG
MLEKLNMTRHADNEGETCHKPAGARVPKDNREERVLPEYDATTLVGLRTMVTNAAIQRLEDGETTVELPKLDELFAATAIARCLLPVKLRGWEIKAIRHILGMTLAELAKRLDKKTAVDTLSRWESDAQTIGTYAERVLRLVVCERLKEKAPGMDYNAAMLAELEVEDPWKADDYQVPYIELGLIRIKEKSGSVIEAWDTTMVAA